MARRYKLTRSDLIEMFRDDVLPYVRMRYESDGRIDVTARREAWNDWMDSLRAEGIVSASQYDNDAGLPNQFEGRRRRRNPGGRQEVRLSASGWTARWSGSHPRSIDLDYEGDEFIRSQSVIRYSRGKYGYDWPEVVPDGVKKKLHALFERLHRGGAR